MYNEFQNIKVPDNLDEVIKKSIKKAKHHKKIKLRKIKFLKVFGGIAAGFVIFTGAINVSPALAKSLNNVPDRKSTRLNSSHANISYAVFCLKKKKSQKSRKQ